MMVGSFSFFYIMLVLYGRVFVCFFMQMHCDLLIEVFVHQIMQMHYDLCVPFHVSSFSFIGS